MAATRRPRKPPEWFKLSDYGFVRDFDSRGWYAALENRWQLQATLEFASEILSEKPNDKFYNDLKKTVVAKWLDRRLSWGKSNPRPSIEPDIEPPVHEFTAQDLAGVVEFLQAVEAYGNHVKPSSLPDPLDLPLRDVINLLSGPEGRQWFEDYRLLRIRLSTPDAVLAEDFQRWLRDIRQSHPIRVSRHGPKAERSNVEFTDIHFGRWRTHQIIPLYDLKLWCQYKRLEDSTWQKYSNPALYSWLFPHQRSTSDPSKHRSKRIADARNVLKGVLESLDELQAQALA